MKDRTDIWQRKPAEQDYIAAEKYLTLLFMPEIGKQLIKKLRAAPTLQFEVKDLLRASQTHLLDKDNPHVAETLKKIRKGKKISPVLLIRGDGTAGVTLAIADGYHRICACWHWNEKCPVVCCLVDLPEANSETKRRTRKGLKRTR